MKYLTTILLLLILLQPAWSQSPALSNLLSNVGLDQKLDNQVPLDLVFRNENGDSVRLGSIINGNRPAVISLVYYECPELCTEILNGMVMGFRQIPFAIGKDFDVITVSINPGETPQLAAQKKHAYLHSYPQADAGAGWHFMVGDTVSIRRLADAIGYRFVYDKETDQYAHPSGIVITTPSGRVARYMYGVEYPYKDLRFALTEASGNKIGSPVDKILLLCYHYDPATGTYGVAVMNILRIGGILTLVILGSVILIMLRRERKHAVPAPADNHR